MKRLLVIGVLLAATGVGVAALFGSFEKPLPPEIRQIAVTRGDIHQTVTATGTLQATRTVDVGSQISGVVKKLYVDYNSIVTKGELIAEMDPQTVQTQLDSAKASLDRSKIDLEGLRATLKADELNRDREVQLFASGLATAQDRDAAVLQVKQDEGTVKEDEAAVAVATDNVKQAQVNLDYCTIRSPVDGVVITRNADEGQTVAASVSVPSLFIIATDVRTLDLLALVDESDIGKLHPDQDVMFTVPAYPTRQFHGRLDHVRLNSVNSNNVITYQAVASVKNDDLRLMPSMTASVKVQIADASDVVRVPNTALRFKPSKDMFTALGQPVPPEVANAPLVPAPKVAPPVADQKRTAAQQTVKDNPPKPGEMIDRRFRGSPRASSTGQVWSYNAHQLKPLAVQLGITDGTWTELVDNTVQPGDELVASVLVPRKK